MLINNYHNRKRTVIIQYLSPSPKWEIVFMKQRFFDDSPQLTAYTKLNEI